MSTTMPLVTVCVPTIGRTEYLKGALQSLTHQTYPNCEILILDNASGLDAQAIVAAFAASRSNVRVLRSDVRLPMFQNFNRGIASATGEYIVFFHDDDLYDPAFLTRHVELLEAFPRTGFAGGNFNVIDGDGRIARRHRGIDRSGVWGGRFFIERLYRRGRSDVPTPSLVFRRVALGDGGFDERLPMNWGDFTVTMRIAERWDVGVVSDRLYNWRVHGQNSSKIPLSRALALRTIVLGDYLAEYLSRHPDEKPFVERLRSLSRRDLLRSLVWAWLVAPDESEASACRDVMAASHLQASRLLAVVEALGASARRRQVLHPAARFVLRRLRS